MMDLEMFKMQMKRLSSVIQAEVSLSLVEKEYYPKFKTMDSQRFAKIVEYLIDNWKFKSFPTIANFKDAQSKTAKATSSKTNFEKATVENFIAGGQRVRWAWKQMGKIRRQVIPDFNGDNTVASCTTMHDFYGRMVEENRVWSLQTQKWVDKRNAVQGEYFDPKEFGFPVRAAA